MQWWVIGVTVVVVLALGLAQVLLDEAAPPSDSAYDL